MERLGELATNWRRGVSGNSWREYWIAFTSGEMKDGNDHSSFLTTARRPGSSPRRRWTLSDNERAPVAAAPSSPA